MKKVLMVAFHFPPCATGSGHLRTLGFARHLPACGWQPIVLSARPAAYPAVNAANGALVPDGCQVRRVLALDAGRHLAIAGKYPAFIARPDRWASWWPAAVWQGMRLIRREGIDAIWSTYPIMTAHCIGHALRRRSGLPWIADFRDPVRSSVGAGNRLAVASQLRWEERVVRTASRTVLTTPSALRAYAERYRGAVGGDRFTLIENGYEEHMFDALPPAADTGGAGPRVLVHSGTLYQDGRDPQAFFEALSRLRQVGDANAGRLHVVLRASSNEDLYQRRLDALGIGDLVTLAPPVDGRAALREQMSAAGLLLFQGSQFDRQIPAKVYEYLRIGAPIFALVGSAGDTAALLRSVDRATLVPMDEPTRIAEGLAAFLDRLDRSGTFPARRADVSQWSRRARAAQLGALLDAVTA